MQARLIRSLGAALTVIAVTVLAPSSPTVAEGFYQGKRLEIIVASGVGESYDTLSRLIGRHIVRYLPGNPPIVIRNMPGAGGIVAANQLYNISPKNGPVIGMLDQSIYETQLFKVVGL